MTVYEQMMNRLELLSNAAERCIDRNNSEMACIWIKHHIDLKAQIDCMPITIAGALV